MESSGHGLPYLHIYEESPNGYSKSREDVFIHGIPVHVIILRRIYGDEKHGICQEKAHVNVLYDIEFTHGAFKWTIQRTHAEFKYLARHLPSGRAGKNSTVVRYVHPTRVDLPKCPSKSEDKITTEEQAKDRIRKLELFINAVFKKGIYRNTVEALQFAEVSRLSFISDLGEKLKEGIVMKTYTNNPVIKAGRNIASIVRSKHKEHKWLILKDTFVALLRLNDDVVRDVLLMDTSFQVLRDVPEEGKYAFKVSNMNREVVLECLSKESAENWFLEITVAANKAEDFVQHNRLESFAPERPNILSKWFVDGCDYFDAVADGLEAAREEILIADWMLSPELCMKRRSAEDLFWRLDTILERKAKQGVKIFVLIFREVELVLGLNSEYVKQKLQQLHPENIKVLRHRGFSNIMFWSPHDKIVVIDQKYAFLGGIDLCFGRWDDSTHRLVDVDRRWPGKDYMNFIYKDFQNVENPFEDLINREEIQRMPWHDVGVFIQGKSARDLARHFVQRWNFAKSCSHKDDHFYPLLMPKSYKSFEDLRPLFPNLFNVNCQVLRSANDWSAGINQKERSIQTAYLKIINEAKHFIYIENQFFVSLTKMGSTDSPVSNEIANTLYKRIIRAHKSGEAFRVYVVIPLLPGVEGDITSDETGTSIRAVTHWNYQSICRGQNSLLGRLKNEVGDPTRYFSFCALRTYDTINNIDGSYPKPVTELVYVHSKVIIADDRVAVIGSANINDRSMMGDRDSEVAVILEDVNVDEGPTSSGKFVGSMRKHIFREHLGLLTSHVPDERLNPASQEFFEEIWLKTASINTNIFEEVFRCIPNDNIRCFHDLLEYRNIKSLSETDPEGAHNKLKGIKGHLVFLPTYFLDQENLAPPLNKVEGVIPTTLYT